MLFSKREERKLRRLATEKGMRASPDSIIREGSSEKGGILVRLRNGTLWLGSQWHVTFGGRSYAVGYDPDCRMIAYADAADSTT
jgi:hypothetical protein